MRTRCQEPVSPLDVQGPIFHGPGEFAAMTLFFLRFPSTHVVCVGGRGGVLRCHVSPGLCLQSPVVCASSLILPPVQICPASVVNFIISILTDVLYLVCHCHRTFSCCTCAFGG